MRDKHTHPLHSVFMASAKRLREKQHFTQAQVAEKIGMDVQKYSRLERTVNFCPITMDEAFKISTALHSSILAMTFSNRMESWLLEMDVLLGKVKDTRAELQSGMDALDGVVELINLYQGQMAKERHDFTQIASKYASTDIIRKSHDTVKNGKRDIDAARQQMAKVKYDGRPNVIEV